MIQSLSIRNIALIDHLTIDFHPGLQVLTGETGAGKSIVVDAVTLILGARADRGMIRSGEEKASVEAVFDVPDQKGISAILERESIDFDGRTVTVYREMTRSGKNLCRICGVMMPVSFLKELSPLLMNMHGQSEHQVLADPQSHMAYLDQMGDPAHRAAMRDTEKACAVFMENHRAYAKLVRKNNEKEARLPRIERELEELREAALQDGEEETLLAECRRLEAAGKIAGSLRSAYRALISGDGESGSMASVKTAAESLKNASALETDAEELSARCDSAYYELEDIAYRINQLIEKNDDDPVRLERAQTRLDLIRRLEKRYGSTVSDVLAAENALEEEYAELTGLDERIREMGQEHKKRLAEYRAAARALTESRKRLATRFEESMMRELKDLGMGHTVFRVQFSSPEDGKPKMPSPLGDDQLEFMISPNVGEPLMPMAKIASGGELSRLMLAMKTLEAGHTGVDSMIFDEIDTGISGRMAQVVAEKMITISRHHQVICVSHLPQLAAAGDYQYLVKKRVEGERTLTSVEEKDPDGRVDEIARIISGAGGITEETRAYARRLLQEAARLKSGTQA